MRYGIVILDLSQQSMQSLIALGDMSLIGVEMYLFCVFNLFDVNHWDSTLLHNFQRFLFIP